MTARFELLALDLDDTLLTTELTIAEEDRYWLERARRAGVRVVLATGRGPDGMRRFWVDLGLDRHEGYAIGYNGALAVRTDSGEELFRYQLDSEVARLAALLCQRDGFAVQTYRDGFIKVSRENDWTHHDSQLTGLPNVVVPLEELCSPPPVKLVIPGDPPLLPALKARLEQALGRSADLVISKPYFLEVLPPGVNKGHALERLCGILGVSRERVMAIGDAMNDAEMVARAGFGVAMANAVAGVRAVAQAVTERDHDHAGVAEAIQRWLFT